MSEMSAKYEADGPRVWMHAQVRLPGQGNKSLFPARVQVCALPEHGGPMTAQQIADALNLADQAGSDTTAAGAATPARAGSAQ